MLSKRLSAVSHVGLVLLVALFALASAAEEAEGIVFHDLNGNGVYDVGEPPIPGVAVSNGEEVVLTDSEGRYRLPMPGDGVVFVIKPANWAVPVDPATQIPQGHYIHRPEGSPSVRFGGVPPTGPLPESIDFPLRPQREAAQFTMICLGDTQPRDLEEVHFLAQDLVPEVSDIDAAFGFTLGDLVFDDLRVFEPMTEAIGMIGVPWHHVPGNHDMDFDAPTWQQTFETYQHVFGPSYYAFTYGDAHVFVLNNIRWDVEERKYHAEFGEQQRNFIANYLAYVPKDHLVIFLMHIPVMGMYDRDEFFALFDAYPHTLSLSAHWHRHEHFFLGEEDGWQGERPHHHIVHGTAGGAWYRGYYDAVGIPTAVMADGVPKGYSLIEVNGNEYAMAYRATRRPETYQMDIYAPAGVEHDAVEGQEVIVNFFNGTERCRVEMRLNDGPWVTLEQFRGYAPFYLELFQRQELFLQLVADVEGLDAADDRVLRRIENLFRPVVGRGMPGPAETNHLWRGGLTDHGREGYNVIEVRAHDMFGAVHTAKRYLRVN